MKLKYLSLKRKIIYSVISLILFFGSLATILTFYFTQNILMTQAQIKIADNTSYQADETYRVLQFARDLALQAAKNDDVLSYVVKPPEVEAAKLLDLSFLNNMNVSDMFSAIYLLDRHGVGLISTDRSFIGQDYSVREYFKQAVVGVPYFDVALGMTSGQLGYYFSAPVIVGNNVEGVIVFKMRPQVVEKTVAEHEGGSVHFSLVDQYGIIVFCDDATKRLSSLGPLSSGALAELRSTKRFGKNDFKVLDYAQIMKALPDVGKTAQIWKQVDEHDKQDEILSFVRVREFPLYILGEVNTTDIFATSFRSSMVIALMVLFAALSAMLAIWKLVSQFLAPLKDLTDYAGKIGMGEYSTKLDLNTGDELEVLELGLKKMAIDVQESHNNIEEKIKERTVELEKMNNLMVDREIKMTELKKRINELEKK